MFRGFQVLRSYAYAELLICLDGISWSLAYVSHVFSRNLGSICSDMGLMCQVQRTLNPKPFLLIRQAPAQISWSLSCPSAGSKGERFSV